MKKTIKKIALSLLVANFAFLGLAQNSTYTSYAAEEQLTADYQKQKEQLSYAIADRSVVVSTEAYNKYASENAKARYEKAIADGQAVIEKGDNATFEELAIATSNINQAKATIWKDVDRLIKIEKLKVSVERNRTSIKSAKFLLENAPKTVAKVKDKLIEQIRKAEDTIQRSEAYLAKQL